MVKMSFFKSHFQVSSLVENEIRPAMLDNIRDNPKFKVSLFLLLRGNSS